MKREVRNYSIESHREIKAKSLKTSASWVRKTLKKTWKSADSSSARCSSELSTCFICTIPSYSIKPLNAQFRHTFHYISDWPKAHAIDADPAQQRMADTELGLTVLFPAIEESMKAKLTEATKRTITSFRRFGGVNYCRGPCVLETKWSKSLKEGQWSRQRSDEMPEENLPDVFLSFPLAPGLAAEQCWPPWT